MATDGLREIVDRINTPQQRVRKNQSSGAESSEKATSCLEQTLKWNNSPDKEIVCLRNIIYSSCLFWSQLSKKRLLFEKQALSFVENV